MMYSAKLLHYLRHSDHAGELSMDDQNVFYAKMGSVNTVDVVELYLKIDGNMIQQARFRAHGAAALIAASEYVCEWLEGKTTDQAKQLTREMILAELDLPLTHIHHAALLFSVLHEIV